MDLPRHQCLIYSGPPSQYLAALAAAGLDVLEEIADGSLILNSAQTHLHEGKFDPDSMIQSLRDSLDEAREDGYAGLWASGDMAWEFGPEKDFSRLVEYEWRLEELFGERPDLRGVCQYHTGTLPEEYLRQGLVVHGALFVNETLSRINPHFLSRELFSREAADRSPVQDAVGRLLREGMPA
ncbi:MAG: MEDS domain-containing protein [Acidobacteriota bacterium]